MCTAIAPATLRMVIVEDLGRDALVLSRYGLVLVDARAAVERPGAIQAWLNALG